MRLVTAIAGEFVRALAVLAFVFLSFAPPPVAIERYGVSPAVSAAVDNGARLPGDARDPFARVTRACDDCRFVTAAILPTLPTLHRPTLVVRPRDPALPAREQARRPPVRPGGGPRAPPVRAVA